MDTRDVLARDLQGHVARLQNGSIKSTLDHNASFSQVVDSALKAMQSAATHGEAENASKLMGLYGHLVKQQKWFALLESDQVSSAPQLEDGMSVPWQTWRWAKAPLMYFKGWVSPSGLELIKHFIHCGKTQKLLTLLLDFVCAYPFMLIKFH